MITCVTDCKNEKQRFGRSSLPKHLILCSIHSDTSLRLLHQLEIVLVALFCELFLDGVYGFELIGKLHKGKSERTSLRPSSMPKREISRMVALHHRSEISKVFKMASEDLNLTISTAS